MASKRLSMSFLKVFVDLVDRRMCPNKLYTGNKRREKKVKWGFRSPMSCIIGPPLNPLED